MKWVGVKGWKGFWVVFLFSSLFLGVGKVSGKMLSSSGYHRVPGHSSHGPASAATGTGAVAQSLLKAERAYLSKCRVQVVIKNQGRGFIPYEKYRKGKLVLSFGRKTYRWSMAKVDPDRKLVKGGGKVVFDTRVVLASRARVNVSFQGLEVRYRSLSVGLSPSGVCMEPSSVKEASRMRARQKAEEAKGKEPRVKPSMALEKREGGSSHPLSLSGGRQVASPGRFTGVKGGPNPREMQGGMEDPTQARGREVLDRDREFASQNRSPFTGQDRGSGGRGLNRQGQGFYGPSSPGGNNLPQGGYSGLPGTGGGMGGRMPHRTTGANVIGGNEKGWSALKEGDKEAFYSFLDSRTGAQKGSDFRDELYERAWERASSAFEQGDEKKFNQIVEETVNEYMEKEEGVKDKGGDDKYNVGKKGYSNPERLGEKRGSGSPWSAHGSSAPEHKDEATGVQRASHSYVPWDASQKKAHDEETPGGPKVNAGTRDMGEIKSGSQGAETMYRMKTYARDPALGQDQVQEQMEGAAGR